VTTIDRLVTRLATAAGSKNEFDAFLDAVLGLLLVVMVLTMMLGLGLVPLLPLTLPLRCDMSRP
jgi:hypothetical protein